MPDQMTDVQGFMLTYENGQLLISDSTGGGDNLGSIISRDEALDEVKAYIARTASWIALDLVNQLDAYDEEDEDD